jgi:hypothetical protein
MGRGLSQQQKDVLAVLPWLTEDMTGSDVPTVRDVVRLIGLDFTPSSRASVSRAMSRLQARGLVLHVWGWDRGYQRTGYARATPDQVKAREEAKTAFLVRHNPDHLKRSTGPGVSSCVEDAVVVEDEVRDPDTGAMAS